MFAASQTFLGVMMMAMVEKLAPMVPSSVMLILLGSTAAASPGDLILLLVATTIGSTLGCLLLYALGRTLGEGRCARLVARYGPGLGVSDTRYRQMVDRYRRHHFCITLIGQTIPGVRAWLPMPAGMIGIGPTRFSIAVLIGAAIWNGTLLTVGYLVRLG